MNRKMELSIGRAILGTRMPTNDAEADTIKDYLISLLKTVWEEEEGFSGKRPFGNSGWQNEVYAALVKEEWISGELEDGNYPIGYDDNEADRLIGWAIDAL